MDRLKMFKFRSVQLWKDSFTCSISFIALVETVCAISNFGLTDISRYPSWHVKLVIAFVTLFSLCIIIALIKVIKSSHKISLNIRNIPVIIKEGNLFEDAVYWKLIPCDEYFNTEVDDIVIAHNTLHGKFIDNYVSDISLLKEAIDNAPLVTNLNKKARGGNYPLGRIIIYGRFMLLAFTHFIENQARLSYSQYEDCLRTMWKEISRTYANMPIAIPLLGGGICRFEDVSVKNEYNLLCSILWTLKTSNVHISQPITIFLTKSVINKINLYELKKIF